MTESDLSLDLAATFGPILKKSFPDASPRWRYAVAGALAESVITRRSWFAQPVDEAERLREALEDTMSTLSAVKAEAIVDGGGTCLWIAEKLNQQMIDNRAALQHKGEVSRG